MPQPWFRNLRHRLSIPVLRALIFSSSLLPRPVGHVLFGIVFRTFFHLLPKEKKRILHNLLRHFPHFSTSERLQLAKKIYYNLGVSFFDSLLLPRLPKDKFDSYIAEFDKSEFTELLKSGNGLIALSGHLSAFELQTQIVQRAGIESVTVGTNLFSKEIDTIIKELRSRNGVTYIPRDGALRGIIKNLKAGKLFGVLIDQDATTDGVFAPFLGRYAFTPVTTIKLALKYDIPIIFVATYRDKKGLYHMVTRRPSVLSSADNEETLGTVVTEFNEFYSKMIMSYPEQWVWMHWRFRRSPEKYPDIPVVKQIQEDS